MNLSGKRVAVTGATGLLGAATLKMLSGRGDVELRAFARDRQKAEMFRDDPIEIALGDITDRESVHHAVDGCDIVIHSVMAVGDGDGRQINVEGTRHVLDAAVEQGVERLVHISSIAVYCPTCDGVVDESSPNEPDGSGTSYHDTKLESEVMALQYWREKGLPVVVLQPVAVYGPRSRPWTINPLSRLRDNAVLLVDEARTYHNVVYADDVARAMILAAERDGIEGESFIVSGNENILSKDFFGALERMLGVACLAEATGQELEMVDGDLEELARKKGLPLDRPVLKAGFGAEISYSSAKASRMLGYDPQVDFAHGIKLTEAWAREEGLLG